MSSPAATRRRISVALTAGDITSNVDVRRNTSVTVDDVPVLMDVRRAGCALAKVAVVAGFYDQSHLTRCFVRQFGVTPSRYASNTR